MKIRVTVEYDTDGNEDGYEQECKDWLEGNVGVQDIIGAEAGTVKFERVGE